MEYRADVHDIRIGIPGLGYRLLEPGFQLPALLRRVDVLVILHIVQDNQVRPPGPVPAAPYLLSGADGLNLDVLGRQDDIPLPHLSLLPAEVLLDVPVFLQLCLNIR